MISHIAQLLIHRHNSKIEQAEKKIINEIIRKAYYLGFKKGAQFGTSDRKVKSDLEDSIRMQRDNLIKLSEDIPYLKDQPWEDKP